MLAAPYRRRSGLPQGVEILSLNQWAKNMVCLNLGSEPPNSSPQLTFLAAVQAYPVGEGAKTGGAGRLPVSRLRGFCGRCSPEEVARRAMAFSFL